MRHLVPFLSAGGIVLIAGAAYADLGDQIAKLLPGDGTASDRFGFSVAVSATTTIVGARSDDASGADSGSAYLFDNVTGQQIAKLVPNDGAPGDRFGGSVAISGTTAIVGSRGDDDNGKDSGSAYLFDTVTGQQIVKLLPGDGAADDLFGFRVAISGTIVIVSAIGDDDNGKDSGSAYLFDATTGQQISKLLPIDGATLDTFGWSVGISSATAIVGTSSSAYLFDTVTGQQIAKLVPSDGAAGNNFGGSLAISGITAIVGASGDDENGIGSGSAYLFDTATGQEITKLLPDDGASGDQFGSSVAISGTTAIIGATWDDANGFGSGSAYLFDTTAGQQIAKLVPNDGATGDRFGWSVGISSTTALVGADLDDENGTGSGSAYLFVVGTALGTNYCGPANFNSTGQSAVISGFGSTTASKNLVTLTASQLPQNVFGYFLNSDVKDFKPFIPGSQGNLCLGGGIGRHVKQIANSGSAGTVSIHVDLTALPRPGGAHAVVAGETWNFQCWFRDANPGPTSNFTDGIEIVFQ